MISSFELLAEFDPWSGPMWFVYIVLAVIAAVLITVAVIKRCYLVVGPDKAIVKTGMGGMNVTTAGGMLVYPVINQVEYMEP